MYGVIGTVNTIEDHFSIKFMRFLMRIVGMWHNENSHNEFISNTVLAYTFTTMIIATIVEGFDCYYCWGDLHALSYNIPCTITVLLELFKLLTFLINRSEVMSFNAFTENTFWKTNYERADLTVLNNCDSQCVKILIIYFVILQLICWQYLAVPIFESIGKNATDRTLPFNLWFNFPFTETPYYEIAFTLQSAATMSVSICTGTFASFLFTTNLYAAGQFKILQRKLEIACDMKKIENINGTSTMIINPTCTKLKECIKQHQLLIVYIERVENLYSSIMLVQALGGVLQMCFSGFQIILGVENSIIRTLLSIQFLMGAIIQLFLFSWSCHEIIIESQLIAEAAYRGSWHILPYTNEGRMYRQFLLIIIARARKPCILTVGKFAPMSLETFTSVFNTSLSYFTILRQMNENMNE